MIQIHPNTENMTSHSVFFPVFLDRRYPAAQWTCGDDSDAAAQPVSSSEEEECMRDLGVPPRLRALKEPDSHRVVWTEVDPDAGVFWLCALLSAALCGKPSASVLCRSC